NQISSDNRYHACTFHVGGGSIFIDQYVAFDDFPQDLNVRTGSEVAVIGYDDGSAIAVQVCGVLFYINGSNGEAGGDVDGVGNQTARNQAYPGNHIGTWCTDGQFVVVARNDFSGIAEDVKIHLDSVVVNQN